MPRGNATWRIDGRTVLWIVVGALLYGGTSWLTNISPLAGALGGQIRPGVAIPIFMGFTGGPVVGFFVGFLGNLFTDIIGAAVSYPPSPSTGSVFHDIVMGFNLNWQVGNGLMGLFPGLFALFYRRYFSFNDQVKALIVNVLAILAGIGFASLLDPWVYGNIALGGPDGAIATEFIPISRINIINAAILVPILLFNYERLDLTSRDWIRSGLMQRLLLTILISAALPVALLGLFLTQQSTGQTIKPEDLTVKLTFTILLTMVFTVANAVLVAQSISRPLLRLTGAAKQMEEGQLSVEQAGELKATPGSDEVTRLSQIFGQMAQEVIQREQMLRQQVRELQIMIDQSKRDQQVQEIVESDFFQDLQTRAKAMRDRGSPGKGQGEKKSSKKS